MTTLFKVCPESLSRLSKAIEEEKSIVREYFAKKPSSPTNIFLKKHQSDVNRTLVEDIVLGAWNIKHTVAEKGKAPLLFVGRSGCLVQLALEILQEHVEGEKHDLYHINFSGTPDTENVREDHDLADGVKTILVARNFVTTEKRDYFMRYCDSEKLYEVQDKLYLADIIGTGSSLNSVIRILNYYYTQHLKRASPPEYHFLGLSLIYRDEKEELWSFDCNEETLTFDGQPSLGITPLSLKTYPIMLSYGVVHQLLDNDFFQKYIASGIFFPAQKWRMESEDELKRGGLFWKEAYDIIRLKIEKQIQKHQKYLELL